MLEYSDDKVLELLRSPIAEDRSTALRYLYDSIYRFIGAFVIKNGGNATDAEDLFQDGLIAFYENAVQKDFKLSSSIKNYIHGICRNLWFRRFKTGLKEKSVEDVNQYAVLIDEEEDQDAELFKQLDSYFLALSDGCQRILKLYYYEKKSMKEIAELLSLASGGVAKNKKARCLQKLKEYFISQ